LALGDGAVPLALALDECCDFSLECTLIPVNCQ
jgi:hypothetical protein